MALAQVLKRCRGLKIGKVLCKLKHWENMAPIPLAAGTISTFAVSSVKGVAYDEDPVEGFLLRAGSRTHDTCSHVNPCCPTSCMWD